MENTGFNNVPDTFVTDAYEGEYKDDRKNLETATIVRFPKEYDGHALERKGIDHERVTHKQPQFDIERAFGDLIEFLNFPSETEESVYKIEKGSFKFEDGEDLVNFEKNDKDSVNLEKKPNLNNIHSFIKDVKHNLKLFNHDPVGSIKNLGKDMDQVVKFLDHTDVKYMVHQLGLDDTIVQIKTLLQLGSLPSKFKHFQKSVDPQSQPEDPRVVVKSLIRSLRSIVNEFTDPNIKLKQGFGIALLVASVIIGALAFVFNLPLLAVVSIGVISAASLGTGIYLTVKGFESNDAKLHRILSAHFNLDKNNMISVNHIPFFNKMIKMVKIIIEQPMINAYLNDVETFCDL